jgi:hypothetical protein
VVPAEQVGEAVRYSYCFDYLIVPHDDRGAPLVNRPVFVILASRYRWPRLYHSQLSAQTGRRNSLTSSCPLVRRPGTYPGTRA